MNKTILITISITLLPKILPGQPNVAWMRMFGEGRFERFSDVFAAADGDLVLCGSVADEIAANSPSSDIWVLRVNPAGETIWSRTYGEINAHDNSYSIIEDDNGNLLCGGRWNGEFAALLAEESGDLIWRRSYGAGYCFAVIELKNGNFLLSGRDRFLAKLICIEPDGDEVWTRTYGTGENRLNQFNSMRESDGSVLLAGQGWDAFTERYAMWAVEASLEQEGEAVWSRYFPEDQHSYATGIVADNHGGFFIAGKVGDGSPDGSENDFALLSIDHNGERNWFRRYFWGENSRSEYCQAIERVDGRDFCLVGFQWPSDRFRPAAIRVRHDGTVRWRYLIEFEQEDGFGQGRNANHQLYSVTRLADQSLLAAGCVYSNVNNSRLNGLLVKLEPEFINPGFVSWTPEDTTLILLRGDSVDFKIWIRNPDELDVRLLWIRNQVDTLSYDSTTQVSCRFEDLGDEEVYCALLIDQLHGSICWHISVRDLFVYSHTPDTLDLTLRRGTTQEFTLDSIAVTEGMPVSYAWTLTDIDNFDRFDLGEDSAVSVEFLRSGNYSVEGLAYRGEAQDNVVWTVRVRSAILDFLPGELNLSVLPDSLVNFEVIPFNPESDSLSFRWELDGDSVGAEAALGLRFGGDGFGNPSYQVAAMVFDGGEGDTVTWRVTVRPPAAAGEFGIGNLEFRIGEPAPNPFNATTTISYILDKPGRTRLSVFDLSGRKVARLADGSREAGIHSALWEASGLPAGVYLLRLESGGRIAVGKAVVVR